MKKAIFLLLAMIAMSCSNDDGPSSKPFASKIILTSEFPALNNVISLHYDDKKRLSSVVKTGGQSSTCDYVYNDLGQISKLLFQTGEDPARVIYFTDDDDNRLTQYDIDDVNTEVTYDEATRTYTIGGLEIILNEHGEFHSLFENVYTYDTPKKGVFKNAKTDFNFQLIGILHEPMFLFFANKTAVTDITNESTDTPMYTVTNTYDDDGYIIEAVVTGVGPDTASFSAVIEYTDI